MTDLKILSIQSLELQPGFLNKTFRASALSWSSRGEAVETDPCTLELISAVQLQLLAIYPVHRC